MAEQPREARSAGKAASGSAAGFRGALRFVGRHPIGVVQSIFFALVAVVILQNLESTSIEVLFWSVPALPKVVLIFLSMVVGAVAWELARRSLRR